MTYSLYLFYFSHVLSTSYYWLALAVPYLISRGLSGTEVFSLMSLYQLYGVFLEYPTGVLGDRYGYRKMLHLGNILALVAMIALIIASTYLGFALALFVLSLASGFVSGNDMGMLKRISTHIKRDTANYHAIVDLSLFVSSIVGGYLASYYGYNFALILSGILMASASIPLYLIKYPSSDLKATTASLTHILKDGVATLKKPMILQLFIIIAIYGGFSFTIKSILGSFGEILKLDLVTISLYIGLGGLARALGGIMNARLPAKSPLFPLIVTSVLVLAIGFANVASVVLNTILITQVAIGYILSMIDGDIQELVSDHVRSSLFSLKRLVMRILSAFILSLYGYIIDVSTFNILFFLIGIIMISSLFFTKKYLNANLSQK